MCDEDQPFVLLRRDGVQALAIPDEVLRRDERVLAAFAPAYPVVAGSGSAEGRQAGYALAERWPNRVRSYWGYSVLRTELSVVDRADRNRVLGTASLYRRVERDAAPFARLRARLAPPAEACTAGDRVEFVKRVLRPPD